MCNYVYNISINSDIFIDRDDQFCSEKSEDRSTNLNSNEFVEFWKTSFMVAFLNLEFQGADNILSLGHAS